VLELPSRGGRQDPPFAATGSAAAVSFVLSLARSGDYTVAATGALLSGSASSSSSTEPQ
jgi:hypothetical protein